MHKTLSSQLQHVLHSKGFLATPHPALSTYGLQNVKLVCDWSVMKATLLDDQIPSWLYLFFNSRDFPETTYTALSTHGLQNL